MELNNLAQKMYFLFKFSLLFTKYIHMNAIYFKIKQFNYRNELIRLFFNMFCIKIKLKITKCYLTQTISLNLIFLIFNNYN